VIEACVESKVSSFEKLAIYFKPGSLRVKLQRSNNDPLLLTIYNELFYK